ncbi:MAG: hypothetical protein OEY87_07335 [Gammaproteobacteria bacterium]|nr:hypothetical protein [Gammaproteobacteria bacterium]MDH5735920.1 hypothetical protein [Gammaproteobacteria bacterium]
MAEELSAMNLRFEQWEISRQGEKLVKIPELTELVRLWSENTEKIIEMRYPGGEEGELWVQEFMDWLIALGVPSSSMYAVPGSGNEDIIKIVLVQGKQSNE